MTPETKTPRELAAPTVVELVDGYADLDDDERLRIDIEIGELRRLLSLIPEGERIEGEAFNDGDAFGTNEDETVCQYSYCFVPNEGEPNPKAPTERPAVLYVKREEKP